MKFNYSFGSSLHFNTLDSIIAQWRAKSKFAFVFKFTFGSHWKKWKFSTFNCAWMNYSTSLRETFPRWCLHTCGTQDFIFLLAGSKSAVDNVIKRWFPGCSWKPFNIESIDTWKCCLWRQKTKKNQNSESFYDVPELLNLP